MELNNLIILFNSIYRKWEYDNIYKVVCKHWKTDLTVKTNKNNEFLCKDLMYVGNH